MSHFFRLIGERVNKNNLTKGLFTALLLVSSVVNADEKYPAADFQPSVVYQDQNYIQNNSSTKTSVKQTASAAANEASHEVDSKYPAANFEPKVLYSDDKYQHNKTTPNTSKNVSTDSAKEESVAAETVSAEKKAGDSSMTYLLGLIGLAAVGFFLFRKQEKPVTAKTKTASVATASTAKVAATTGVGKYINKVSGTGVSRYVEKQVKVEKSATSVSKYVAQKTLADKAKAAEEAEKKATGVEKYMRNRG